MKVIKKIATILIMQLNIMKKKNKLLGKIFLAFFLTFVFLGLGLFLPAGSIKYWEGWVFICIILISVGVISAYLIKHDPELLERRMQFKEKEIQQKIIIIIADILFLIGFLLCGFDYRYAWSNVPIWLVILSDIVIVSGYRIIFFVFKENSYTSRIVEVEKGQKVITTGPYSIIRHPMYVGVTLMFLFMPMALGSYLALIFFVPIIAILIFRILNEEKILLRDLKGYDEYTKKVKYRLIPKIW